MNVHRKRLTWLTVLLTLVLLLTACGASTFVSQPNQETGGIDVTAENAGKGSGTIGYVTIGEGQCLVISPDLSKGKFTVRILPVVDTPSAETTGIGGEALLVETIQDRKKTAYSLEPGEYAVAITVAEKATGTMMILPYSVEELAQQDASLSEALDQAKGQ